MELDPDRQGQDEEMEYEPIPADSGDVTVPAVEVKDDDEVMRDDDGEYYEEEMDAEPISTPQPPAPIQLATSTEGYSEGMKDEVSVPALQVAHESGNLHHVPGVVAADDGNGDNASLMVDGAVLGETERSELASSLATEKDAFPATATEGAAQDGSLSAIPTEGDANQLLSGSDVTGSAGLAPGEDHEEVEGAEIASTNMATLSPHTATMSVPSPQDTPTALEYQAAGDDATEEDATKLATEDGEAYEYDDELAEDDEQEEEEEEVAELTPHNLPPILIHLPPTVGSSSGSSAIRSLFAGEEGGTSAIWFEGREEEFCGSSLSDCWSLIREEMAKENVEKEHEELVVMEKNMELHMGEDDVNLQTITFLDFIQTYVNCGLPEPVQLYLTFTPHRFSARYYAIQKELAALREVDDLDGVEAEEHEDAQDEEEQQREIEPDQEEKGVDELVNEAGDERGEQERPGATERIGLEAKRVDEKDRNIVATESDQQVEVEVETVPAVAIDQKGRNLPPAVEHPVPSEGEATQRVPGHSDEVDLVGGEPEQEDGSRMATAQDDKAHERETGDRSGSDDAHAAGSGASGMIEQKDEDGLVDDNGDTAVAVGSADQEEVLPSGAGEGEEPEQHSVISANQEDADPVGRLDTANSSLSVPVDKRLAEVSGQSSNDGGLSAMRTDATNDRTKMGTPLVGMTPERTDAAEDGQEGAEAVVKSEPAATDVAEDDDEEYQDEVEEGTNNEVEGEGSHDGEEHVVEQGEEEDNEAEEEGDEDGAEDDDREDPYGVDRFVQGVDADASEEGEGMAQSRGQEDQLAHVSDGDAGAEGQEVPIKADEGHPDSARQGEEGDKPDEDQAEWQGEGELGENEGEDQEGEDDEVDGEADEYDELEGEQAGVTQEQKEDVSTGTEAVEHDDSDSMTVRGDDEIEGGEEEYEQEGEGEGEEYDENADYGEGAEGEGEPEEGDETVLEQYAEEDVDDGGYAEDGGEATQQQEEGGASHSNENEEGEGEVQEAEGEAQEAEDEESRFTSPSKRGRSPNDSMEDEDAGGVGKRVKLDAQSDA